MTVSVLIVVTHLLGTGHLRRALILGQAYRDAGHAVTVVSGGTPVPHLDASGISFVQLPPLRSDGTDFARLLTDDARLADAQDHARRSAALVKALETAAPDILITELFPFGRRNLRTEFETLLDAAGAMPARPRIFASIRDVLAPPSKPAKAAYAGDMIARHYDAVLVHSDPGAIPLGASWPVGPDLAARLRYTGFVAPPPPAPHPENAGLGEILISAGGGAVGDALFTTARAAAALSPDRTWRVLIGGADAAARCTALMRDGPPNLRAEPARADFREMLMGADASVSLCGYNTAMDVLQTGVPAVFVPFDEGSEVEQGLRADALAGLPGITVIRAAEMTAATLVDAVADVGAAPRRRIDAGAFQGATRSVDLTLAQVQA